MYTYVYIYIYIYIHNMICARRPAAGDGCFVRFDHLANTL